MKTPLIPEVMNILIVEDAELAAASLAYTLSKAFPKADIIIAGTVADGYAQLDETQAKKKPRFDVAILDFMLPPRAGLQPEPDFSLSRTIGIFLPETIIIHVSAYGDDPEIGRFLKQRDTLTEDGKIFVAKEEGWMQQVVGEILRVIHSRRIRQQFNDLFGRDYTPRLQRAHRRRHAIGRGDRMRTLEVATLCTDAGQHWEFLGDSLKADLERVLGHVQDEAGNHYVGVVGPPPPLEPDEDEEVEI